MPTSLSTLRFLLSFHHLAQVICGSLKSLLMLT